MSSSQEILLYLYIKELMLIWRMPTFRMQITGITHVSITHGLHSPCLARSLICQSIVINVIAADVGVEEEEEEQGDQFVHVAHEYKRLSTAIVVYLQLPYRLYTQYRPSNPISRRRGRYERLPASSEERMVVIKSFCCATDPGQNIF